MIEENDIPYSSQDAAEIVEPMDAGNRHRVPAPRHDKIENVSPSVSFCIAKAMDLAKALNHPETTTAHFIIALTLFPESNEWFGRRNFDVQTAWRSSMNALIDQKRVTAPIDGRPPPSSELKSIVNLAQSIGRGRENQDAVMDDVMCIFRDMKSDEPGRQLISGQRPATAAEDALDAIRQLEDVVVRRLDEITTLVRTPPVQPVSTEAKMPRRGTISSMFGFSGKGSDSIR
jgi:ATP-dependent Clp protease ATP-binding subunit ClpA